MLHCCLPDSILLKNIWDCQTRLNTNACSKSAFAATAVPLGVQREKNSYYGDFSQRHHPIYHIIPTTTDSTRGGGVRGCRGWRRTASPVDKGIIPTPAAFPMFVKGRWAQTQCSAGRRTWVSLPGAGWETAQRGPLSVLF